MAILCLSVSSLFSQFADIPKIENGFEVYGPYEATIVGPLKPIVDSLVNPYFAQHERDDRKEFHPPNIVPQNYIHYPDGALQEEYSVDRTPSFNAVFNVNGFSNTGAAPPDPTSACGDLHYVVAINGGGGCQYRVYNKTTGAQIGATLSFPAIAGGSAGDPVVVYDDLADRWVLGEINGNASSINVFVSQTNDITTTGWYSYNIDVAGFDYPKLSMWPSAYFLTCNCNSVYVYALNRTAMLTGAATTVIARTAADLGAFGFQALASVDFDGNNPPPVGAPGIMLRHRDTEGHGPAGLPAVDYLEVFEFAPNFAVPASSTWTSTPTQVSVSEFSSELSSWTDFTCFPQPGTAQLLDPLREVIMNMPQYINFGTHQSIVACHVVDANGSDRGGVRWYEIRKPAATWTLYQEGTYAPGGDTYSRWMPAIAQDINQNIAICYSISASATIYPGLRMTARSSGDPLGQMTLAEYSITAGSSSQANERWGDYFAMTMDPISWNTFYFDGEFMTTGGAWRIRNFAFYFSTNALDMSMYSVNEFTTPQCNSTTRNVDAIIKNVGTTTITNCNVSYSLNGGGTVVIPYVGSLAGGASATIPITLSPIVSGANTLLIYVSSPNGGADQDMSNDTLSYNFNASFGLGGTSTQIQNILCFNQNNGQLSISASSGLPPYTYSIGGSYGASSTFTNIGPGTITQYIKDAAGCIYTIAPTLTFTNPSQITASGSAVNASSGAASDGSITVTASGGTGTLTYNINGGSYQASNVFNNLAAGSYTIGVMDANGCIKTFVISVGALGIDVNPLINSLRVYPNPTFGKVTLSYISTFIAPNSTLDVFDNLGRIIKSLYIGDLSNGQNIEVDITGNARAIYTFRLTSGKWSTEQKIILH